MRDRLAELKSVSKVSLTVFWGVYSLTQTVISDASVRGANFRLKTKRRPFWICSTLSSVYTMLFRRAVYGVCVGLRELIGIGLWVCSSSAAFAQIMETFPSLISVQGG